MEAVMGFHGIYSHLDYSWVWRSHRHVTLRLMMTHGPMGPIDRQMPWIHHAGILIRNTWHSPEKKKKYQAEHVVDMKCGYQVISQKKHERSALRIAFHAAMHHPEMFRR